MEDKKQDMLETQIERDQVLLSFLSTAGATYTKQKPMRYGHSLLVAYL